MHLQGKHIVLGLSGGIACYKAAELCRAMVKEGATVQVVMTEAAAQFITPVTMQALSGRPVFDSQWDRRPDNNMAHINLSREADAVLVAPASADFMAKLLHGRADDLLSLLCLARPIATVPLLIAPAMNREMWSHPATQRNVAQLRADGSFVLDVGAGDQACGEQGDGRMLEPEEILEDLIAHFQAKVLQGRRVLITAGPTFEAMDPVRIDVRSAQDMLQACQTQADTSDILIATAAVADWRSADAAEHKIKKDGSGLPPELHLVENPDILATLAASARGRSGALFCVGFAAESQNLLELASAKRARKDIPLIVGNIGPQTFGQDDNALLLIDAQGATELPRNSKIALARQLVAHIAKQTISTIPQTH